MNFNKLKEQLIKNQDNILEIHSSIKDTTGAKSVDILFYNREKNIFFDKINRVNIETKFLDNRSIIGKAFLYKKAYFVLDIKNNISYNLAIDNPFKMELDNQIVIPILEEKRLKGIIRLSQLPLGFDEIDFKSMTTLDDAFGMIFAKEELGESNDIDDELFTDRVIVSNTVNDIKKLLDILSQNSKNQEIEKLIEYGRDNVDNIFDYLHPDLSDIRRVKQELSEVQNLHNLHSNKKNINILIADDVKINVNILKAMLSKNKRVDKIKLAYDGIETISVIESDIECEDNINIIFLDHHMPGALGSDIARQIKSKESEHNQVIIVSITNDIEIMEANRDIYDYHLPKPFTRDNINKIMTMIKEINHL